MFISTIFELLLHKKGNIINLCCRLILFFDRYFLFVLSKVLGKRTWKVFDILGVGSRMNYSVLGVQRCVNLTREPASVCLPTNYRWVMFFFALFLFIHMNNEIKKISSYKVNPRYSCLWILHMYFRFKFFYASSFLQSFWFYKKIAS